MARRTLKHSFTLLHVDYARLNEKWNYVNVISPYSRLYYIDEGEGYISTATEEIKLEAGNIYIIPSFTLCNLKCPSFLSQYFIHFFEDSPDGISLFYNLRKGIKMEATNIDITNFKRLLHINPNRKINRSNNPKVYEQNIYYKEYVELNNKQSDTVFMESQGILLQLISRFLSSESFEEKNIHTIPAKILDAIGYIQVNLDKNLTVAQLSKRACLHEDYFSRIFYQYAGERPLAYIHTKRIERAQYLITTTNLPFSKIAEQTGFENLPHFFKIFKKLTSLTPGEYAKQNRSFGSI